MFSNSLKKPTVRIWFSLIVLGLLFLSILLTQLATKQARDPKSQAATCAAGQNIATLRPTSNFSTGLFAQSPSSGAHFDKVDEAGAGDGDSTTVIDDTVGPPGGGTSIILFNKQTFDWNNKTIHSVTETVNSKEGVSSTAYFNYVLHNGSSQFIGPGAGADPGYALDSFTWTSSPFSGVGWTGNEVNNLKIGLNSYRSAQGNPLTVTQVWIDVCYSVNQPSPPPPPPVAPKPPPPPNSGGSTKRPPPPPPVAQQTAANNNISLVFAPNPYLSGEMEVTVGVDNNSLSQKFKVSRDGGTFVLTPSSLVKGVGYKFRAYSRNSLIQTGSFVYTDNLSLSIPAFITGDFNFDNQINTIDIEMLLENGFDSQDSVYDANYDLVVNSIDFALVLSNLGKVGL